LSVSCGAADATRSGLRQEPREGLVRRDGFDPVPTEVLMRFFFAAANATQRKNRSAVGVSDANLYTFGFGVLLAAQDQDFFALES
jgi:hypothetical protein